MREVRRWDYPLYDDRTVLVAAVDDLVDVFEQERDQLNEVAATHKDSAARFTARHNAEAMVYALDVLTEALALTAKDEGC